MPIMNLCFYQLGEKSNTSNLKLILTKSDTLGKSLG